MKKTYFDIYIETIMDRKRGDNVVEEILCDHVRRYILYFEIYLDDNGQEKRGLCCGDRIPPFL